MKYIFSVCFACNAILCYALLESTLPESWILLYASLVSLAQIIIVLWRARKALNNTAYTPLGFFMMSYFLVFFQFPITIALDWAIPYRFDRYIIYPVVLDATLLAAIGLSVFCCVYTLFAPKTEFGEVRERIIRELKVVNPEAVRITVSVLILVDYVCFGVFVFAAGENLFLRFLYYDGMYRYQWLAMVSYSVHYQLTSIIVGLFAIYVCIVRPRGVFEFAKLVGWNMAIWLFVICILFVLNGNRGGYLQPLMAMGAIFFIFVKPISWVKFLIIGILLADMLFFVGRNRNGNEHDTGSIITSVSLYVSSGTGSLQQRGGEEGALLPTLDLAGQFPMWTQVVHYFPKIMPYRSGLHTLYGVKKFIPGLSSMSIADDLTEVSSVALFTDIILRNSYGGGTVVLADSYIDFGMAGILAISVMLALVFVFMQRVVVGRLIGVLFYIFGMTFWCFEGLYLGRAIAFSPLRIYLYGGLLIYIIIVLFCMKKKDDRSPSPTEDENGVNANSE